MGNAKATRARMAAATKRRRERMREALDYRIQGLSYSQIAKRMKISVSTAHSYVEDALKDITHDKAEEVLKLELERYNALLSKTLPVAMVGDGPSLDRALNIMARIERLHGVEAPKATDGAAETAAMLDQLLASSLQRLNETPASKE